MKVTFIDSPNDFPKLVLDDGDRQIEVIASDFLAVCIASMGLKYEEILQLANSKVTDSLYLQNFPDCYSNQYDDSSPGHGEELEKSLIALNKFIFDQRDKRLDNLDPTRLNPTARPVGTGTVRINVSVLPRSKELAKRIGGGNTSAGFDEAIAYYAEKHKIF